MCSCIDFLLQLNECLCLAVTFIFFAISLLCNNYVCQYPSPSQVEEIINQPGSHILSHIVTLLSSSVEAGPRMYIG